MNFYLVVFLCCCIAAQAQEVLQIQQVRFNRMKVTEVKQGDILEYKLKGESRYRKHEILGFSDSSIIFGSDLIVKTDQVKVVKLRTLPHLLVVLKKVFLRAGVIFITLDTVNGLILGREELVNRNALIVSTGFFAGTLVLEGLSTKRIRLNSRNSLKVIDADYFNMK